METSSVGPRAVFLAAFTVARSGCEAGGEEGCAVKAWQRQIRERKAAENGDLLGRWWESIEADIKTAEVREIAYGMAEKIILEYEWLGCMPAVVWHCYGIFFGDICGGCVVYGPEYSENLGKQAREQGRKCADWSRFGFEGKMILLSRGACAHFAHHHAGSMLIRRSMDMLPSKYEVVTATTDEMAGEIGTIYQACGFHYVGSMRESNPNVKHRRLDRDGWMINGKMWPSRSIRAVCGSTKDEDIRRYFPAAQKIKQHSKHRYFAFRGDKRTVRAHEKAIAHLIKPYPKRQSSEANAVTNTEARFDPALPLQQ